ncbi:MAG: autotransporter assembly complex family protein [Lonepinella koalarum]|nr:autotransporter assembly complex family protein [Lonepinella koalarum]
MAYLLSFLRYSLAVFLLCCTIGRGFAENSDNVEIVDDEKQANYAVKVEVSGIQNRKIRDNVAIYINQINDEIHDGSEYHQHLVRQAIDKGVRVFGYYQSAVDFSLDLKKNKAVLVAKVMLGEPVKLVQADVQISGQAAQDEEFSQLQQNLPSKGEVISHQKYDDFKGNLQQLAQQRGYFDADFQVHRLEIMPDTLQGWWRLYFHSGDRYRYGEIRFQNSHIREDYLRNMLPIQPGEPYLIQSISSLPTIYSSTNWFNSVLLQPQIREDVKRVDIDVFLQPKKKNSMEVGIGYSSDVGVRFQLGWKKPWINSRGHSFSSDLYVSSQKQTMEATYRIPLLENAVRYYYEISTGVENEKEHSLDTESTAVTFAALRFWNHSLGWQYSLGLRARYDSFTQAETADRTLLIYPTAGVNRTRMKGGLFPTWGDSQRLTIDFGRDWWLSEINFFSVRGSTAWIRTYAENHRMLTRVEVGYLHTKDIQKIPPALRFFAGGDRSVRGYGYKKISPKDPNGKLVGGSKLVTSTLEYQYQVYPDWWLAAFADAGLAANKYSPKELHYGSGLGVRWASPVGAIKVDIATPIRDKEGSKNIQFYIGLGAEI